MTEKRNDKEQTPDAPHDAPKKDDAQPEQPAPESADERLERLQRESLRAGTVRSQIDG